MPTYEYECQSCGKRFERFQSITEEPIKECPVCDKKVKRLIGAGAGFLFKGSGFYCTDYRSQSYRKAEKADKENSESKSSPKDESLSKNAA